jgi:hypothetical protein
MASIGDGEIVVSRWEITVGFFQNGDVVEM